MLKEHGEANDSSIFEGSLKAFYIKGQLTETWGG